MLSFRRRKLISDICRQRKHKIRQYRLVRLNELRLKRSNLLNTTPAEQNQQIYNCNTSNELTADNYNLVDDTISNSSHISDIVPPLINNVNLNDNGFETLESYTPIEFKKFLVTWTIKHKISTLATKELLHAANQLTGNSLPRDRRSLLHTPRTNSIRNMGNGQFFYYGIEKQILKQIKINGIQSSKIDSNLRVQLNVDGLVVCIKFVFS